MHSKIQSHIQSIKHALKNNFCMSKCSLFLVDEDLFLNFLSSSYSLVTGTKNKVLKRGAKDATRMARSTQEHGNIYTFWIYSNFLHTSMLTFSISLGCYSWTDLAIAFFI